MEGGEIFTKMACTCEREEVQPNQIPAGLFCRRLAVQMSILQGFVLLRYRDLNGKLHCSSRPSTR